MRAQMRLEEVFEIIVFENCVPQGDIGYFKLVEMQRVQHVLDLVRPNRQGGQISMEWAIPEHTSQVQRFMRHPGGNILLEIGVLKHFVEVSNLPGIPAGQIQVRVFELGLIEHPTPTLGGSGVPMADVIKHQRMLETLVKQHATAGIPIM